MTYLDTHIVIWLYQGNVKRLSREAARAIERAGQLLISPMVEIELDTLFRVGKIPFTAATVLSDLRARIGLHNCELPFPLVSHAALEIGWTCDVYDRLIVAQAAATGSPLLTSDALIREHYPKALW